MTRQMASVYPKADAARVAVSAIADFLRHYDAIRKSALSASEKSPLKPTVPRSEKIYLPRASESYYQWMDVIYKNHANSSYCIKYTDLLASPMKY
jgi:hypothetical protein